MVLIAVPCMGGPVQEVQRPVFRADVDVVRLDVIATGPDGEFVGDLTIDEFIVHENGERQDLLQAQLVDLRAGGGQPGGAENEPTETTPPVEAGLGGTARSADLGAMVFLVEARGFSLEARHRVVDAWEDIARSTGGYAAPRAVYVIDDGGSLWEVLPLTGDPDAVLGARAGIERRLERVLGPDPAASAVEDGWGAALGVADRGARARSLEVLAALSRAFSFRPGRKSIVWISSGVRTTRFSDPGMIIPEAVEQLEELTRRANSAGVSIYGLDPTLVTERRRRRGSSTRITSRTGPVEELLADPFDSLATSFDALRDSLRIVARGTGAEAYPFTTRLGDAVAEIREDGERYYLLTYARPFQGDGEYHELRVETTRPGVTLRARAGYIDHSREKLALMRASSALAFPELSGSTELPFAAYASWTDDGMPRVQLALDLGAWLEDLVARDDRQLQLAFSAIDPGGRIVDETYELLSWSRGDGPRPSVYVHDWPLEYGRYEIRVAAVDRSTLLVSAGRAVVKLVEPEAGWRVSDPVLLAPGADGLPEPVVAPDQYRGPLTGVYFETWAAEPPRVKAFLEGGSAAALPTLVRKLGPGRFSVLVAFSGVAAGAAGVVRIEVTNPATSASRRLEVDLGDPVR